MEESFNRCGFDEKTSRNVKNTQRDMKRFASNLINNQYSHDEQSLALSEITKRFAMWAAEHLFTCLSQHKHHIQLTRMMRWNSRLQAHLVGQML